MSSDPGPQAFKAVKADLAALGTPHSIRQLVFRSGVYMISLSQDEAENLLGAILTLVSRGGLSRERARELIALLKLYDQAQGLI
jgi:hypothetical protein